MKFKFQPRRQYGGYQDHVLKTLLPIADETTIYFGIQNTKRLSTGKETKVAYNMQTHPILLQLIFAASLRLGLAIQIYHSLYSANLYM